jgi:hypothetical protein
LELIRTGPDDVSFNLNRTDPYAIELYPAIAQETYEGVTYKSYNIKINNTSSSELGFNLNKNALIVVSHFDGAAFNKKDMIKLYDQWMSVVTLYNRTIDDKDGMLAVADIFGLKKFSFMYLLDSQTTVAVDSTFPWDDGTLSLLKTIHVEKTSSK